MEKIVKRQLFCFVVPGVLARPAVIGITGRGRI